MLSRSLLVIVCSVLTFASAVSFAQSTEMQMMQAAEKQKTFIENFAMLAKARNENGVFALLDSKLIRDVGEQQLRKKLNNDVFPFFSQYDKLNNYEQITKAQVGDGRVGLWHYTYIVDTKGKVSPFQIAVIDTDDGQKILSVTVGQCVKGRHPPTSTCPADNSSSEATVRKPVTKEDEIMINTRKLVAVDFLMSSCGLTNPDGSKTVVEKLRSGLFPAGEPSDAESIRQSQVYKELYEKGKSAVMKDGAKLTPEQCSKF